MSRASSASAHSMNAQAAERGFFEDAGGAATGDCAAADRQRVRDRLRPTISTPLFRS